MKALCNNPECKKEFVTDKSSIKKYCNPLCRSIAAELKRKNKRQDTKCSYCRTPFAKRHTKQILCPGCIEEKKAGTLIIEPQAKQKELIVRENTSAENDMIKKFLKKKQEAYITKDK